MTHGGGGVLLSFILTLFDNSIFLQLQLIIAVLCKVGLAFGGLRVRVRDKVRIRVRVRDRDRDRNRADE